MEISKLRQWVKTQLAKHTRGCMCDDCRAARAVRESMKRYGEWKCKS